MQLFAEAVMPELKKFDAGSAIDRAPARPDHRLAVTVE